MSVHLRCHSPCSPSQPHLPHLTFTPHPPTAQSVESSAIRGKVEVSVHSHQPSPGRPPAFAVIVTHLQPLAECPVPQSASQGPVPGPQPPYSCCFLLFFGDFHRTLLDARILGRDNLPLGLVPYSLFSSSSLSAAKIRVSFLCHAPCHLPMMHRLKPGLLTA